MRRLSWFSCGAASAVASYMSVQEHPDTEVLYCDTLKYEHPDNKRFLKDVSRWVGKPIKMLRSQEYSDIYDVFEKTGWLVGPLGARCTTELKKNVRMEYQLPDDIHVFGFTVDEQKRIADFKDNFVDTRTDFILNRHVITKSDCYRILRDAGIKLPAMYLQGYKNNNCIGCVKGGMGYWNKIRVDYPATFKRMAKLERKMGVTILKDRRGGKLVRMYLDELEPGRGRYDAEPDIECGVLCKVGM